MAFLATTLDEVSTRIINTLRDYDPKLLGVTEARSGYCCELLEFLGSIVNCGASNKFLVPRNLLT